MRKEYDSFGVIEVEDRYYWGAQTQRSLQFFCIGEEKMPLDVIYALALIKKTAAIVNCDLKLLPVDYCKAIVNGAEQILARNYDDNFPLSVWQTGSGTQTNMNVNEVIANIANEALQGKRGRGPIHPNDHVNMGQSSNDCFPTAMHISSIHNINKLLLPALEKMHLLLLTKSKEWAPVIKVGRTHMQDATPITLGQEFSGYAAGIEYAIGVIKANLAGLYQIAQGGTAVGTGLNTHPEFAEKFATKLRELTGEPFSSAPNKFLALSTSCAIMQMSSCLSTLATIINKIANDIRLLGSGPRCGLGELMLPENEPGSSIMPGKVNPTQCEALTMICTQVLGNHSSVSIAASNGQLELNVYRPLLIYNILQSIRLLTDGANSFTDNCLSGLKINDARIKEFNERSIMIVAALNPCIGYDKATKIAKEAYKYNLSLKEAAVKLQILSAQDIDKYIDIKKMV